MFKYVGWVRDHCSKNRWKHVFICEQKNIDTLKEFFTRSQFINVETLLQSDEALSAFYKKFNRLAIKSDVLRAWFLSKVPDAFYLDCDAYISGPLDFPLPRPYFSSIGVHPLKTDIFAIAGNGQKKYWENLWQLMITQETVSLDSGLLQIVKRISKECPFENIPPNSITHFQMHETYF